MTFKDWLTRRGTSMHSFAKLTGFPTSTIRNLVLGKPVIITTVKRLVRVTRKYPDPITYDMFPRIYVRGRDEIISGTEAFKRLLDKKGAFTRPKQQGIADMAISPL